MEEENKVGNIIQTCNNIQAIRSDYLQVLIIVV